jgi:hypothetical protein
MNMDQLLFIDAAFNSDIYLFVIISFVSILIFFIDEYATETNLLLRC